MTFQYSILSFFCSSALRFDLTLSLNYFRAVLQDSFHQGLPSLFTKERRAAPIQAVRIFSAKSSANMPRDSAVGEVRKRGNAFLHAGVKSGRLHCLLCLVVISVFLPNLSQPIVVGSVK